MMRCTGSQGTAFACMVAGMQEPLDAARSVCAVVFALAGGDRLRRRPLPATASPPALPGPSKSRTPQLAPYMIEVGRRKYVVHTTLICETWK